MTRSLLPAVALLLLVVSGVVHGLWTDRWRTSDEPAAWAARLDNVPRSIGEWDGQDLPVESKHLQVAEATGCLARAYVHRRTGEVVSVVVVCGRPGPVSVHTPDVCYRDNGHGLVETPEKFLAAVPGRQAEFWTARFRKGDTALPTYLRVFWSWNGGGGWKAPANPRLEFARRPALYKLYVIRQLAQLEEAPGKDPCTEFLPLLLPELRRALFPEGD
jgi:hypothetical protein